MEKNRWWLAIPTAFIVMIANIVIAVAWVAVYSHFIDPGHDEAYYQAYAQASVPYSAIIAGIPLMFLATRYVAGKFPQGNRVKAALLVWLVYFLIDLTIMISSGELGRLAIFFVASFATKFGAAYFGGLTAQRRGGYLRR